MAERIAVYIPTPGGPVRIEDLGRYASLNACLVRRRNEMDGLPLTRAYDAFVDGMASVRHAAAKWFLSSDDDGPATFELRLSEAIDSGDSWRLGLLAAHGLAQHGRLARDAPEDGAIDKADAVLWVTGDLGRNLDVLTVSHVEDKLAASQKAFANWCEQGLPVILTLPAVLRGSVDEAALPSAADMVWTSHADQLLQRLGLLAAANPSVVKAEPEATTPRYRPVLIVAALAMLTAAAVLSLSGLGKRWLADTADTPVPSQSPPAVEAVANALHAEPVPEEVSPVAPSIRVFERRAGPGEGCAGVHFATAAAIETEITAAANTLPNSRFPGLCGLRFRVEAAGAQSELLVTMAVESGALLPGAAEALPVERAFRGVGEWAFDLPRHMATPLAYTITATTSKTASDGAPEMFVRVLAHKVVP